jgi:type VI secretion system secreted protein VgrG
MSVSQQDRIAAISTPLGEDVLVLSSFSTREELGRLFEYQVAMESEDHQVDFNAIVGENVTLALNLPNEEIRYFNGYVSRFGHAPIDGNLANYHATVVPWFWFLTRTSDCRIFQEKSIPDIIKEVFRDRGMSDFRDDLKGSYKTWEYCVQYRETDFNFISRLMEQEGIYYYFEHENGKHTLVLVDDVTAHQPFAGYDSITYRNQDQNQVEEEYVHSLNTVMAVQPGRYALNDFDFEKPKASLAAGSDITNQHAQSDYEIYDYPGEYKEFGDGENYAQVRIEELQVDHHEVEASAKALGIAVGYKFALEDHPRDDQNLDYLVTSCRYNVSAGEYHSGGASPSYSCEFSAKKADIPFRLKRTTPKPLVNGPQTAFITGPSGEEIHTDEYGRVKCQFHWDRRGTGDDKSSCWIRVAQLWAGKKWGAIYLPRVGQEVIVEFLEGDPDRPIVTGRVYNGDCMPPYDLPANKTMSTIKSSSSKGSAGFNEIRFEDKKGEEQVFIHAEKNQDTRVKNNCYETIGNDRHLTVHNDQKEIVEHDREETVENDHKEKIGKDRHLKIVGKEAKSIDGSQSLTVNGDVIEVFNSNHSEKVADDYYLKASNIVIEASQNITIKVGKSYIAIDNTGIKISTAGKVAMESKMTTDISSTAPMNISSAATATLKSTMTSVKGDGMVVVEGALVKIN